MRESLFKIALVYLLIFSITFSQIVPSLASANHNKLQVAFVGFRFDNVPQDVQDMLVARINEMLETHPSIVLTKPEGARAAFGRKRITELIEFQDAESFLAFAKQYEFDYVFSGYFANQSSDNNQIFLVGELNRYDLSGGHVNRYRINKDYDKIGSELDQFKKQYIKTLIKVEDSGPSLWPVLLMGGIVVAGLLTFRFALGGVGGEEQTETPPPDE
ncbi:MAG: hypothetical protein ACE5NG_05895 [bacterium]